MSALPPIKNTSGEGFAVEDSIVALLAAHLLAGISWPGAGEGTIRSFECQMRQSGWLFDDVVMQLEHNGDAWQCACSIKSYAVFGKQGAPSEFAKALWEQWFDKSKAGFRRGVDSLTLVCSHHEPDIREAWVGLGDAARTIAPEAFTERLSSSSDPSTLRRHAFESLQNARDSADADKNSTDAAELLQCFRLIEHDFQHAESQSATHAILLCQQILADEARARASELWSALVSFSSSIRRKGGQITLTMLLSELSHQFPLKQYPQFAADWSSILQESQQRMEALPVKLGGMVSVERSELLNKLSELADAQGIVTIIGESGNGKSALTRQWATRGHTVWLRAEDLSSTGGLRSRFRLSHGIPELFTNVSQPVCLVLDGLDKCFDESAFDETSLVLRSALDTACRDRWQIALTCCPEDWERVHRELIRRGIVLKGAILTVGRFTDTELRYVCSKIPTLRLLGQRPHLQPILRWPKALDLVTSYWQAETTPLPWASESDFSRWFWESVICKNERISFRDRVARIIAVQLADRMVATVRLDDFSSEEIEIFAELAQEGHLEIDQTRRTVRFAHELVADWARQQELKVQSDVVGQFLRTRLHSPFWHRALRFHGLDLLEGHPDDTAWRRLFAEFSEESPIDEMAQNLLLEAPIFTSQQQAILDMLWPAFELDDGKLLRRFLKQFLRVATIPDENLINRFTGSDAELRVEAATLCRLPWWPYWSGVLAFLASHAEQVTTLAREQIADLCVLWLGFHDIFSVGMNHAAHLAIISARQVYQNEGCWHGGHNRVSAEEKACRALLAAAPVKPDQVTELVLKFCGRRSPEPEDGSPGEERRSRSRSRFVADQGPPTPWPEGPQRPYAQIFCNAFINGTYSAPLFRALPEIGAEVMFAVLLSLPHANSSPRDLHSDIDEHGFASNHLRDKSCFWISGPFFTFLRINPSVALSAIIRLVNFATDRASEIGEDLRQHLSVPVCVDGETREWYGHQFSYVWHQGHVFAPRMVGCALLSLEKWLYLLMDEGVALDEYIQIILRESRSIAFAGVLISVGKRKPELFLGPLRPLIEAVDFHFFEDITHQRGENGFHASAFYERSTAIREMWREWVQMPHRNERISQLMLRMFFNDSGWREMILECRSTWEARLAFATEENPAPPWLARIASQFDISNWRTQQEEDQTLLIYDPPASLPQPTPEELEHLKRTELLTLIPFQCYRILTGEIESSEGQMAIWWSQLEDVRALSPSDDEDGLRDAEDALCGIVAVAIIKHHAWLAADPMREGEAYSILSSIGANPPSPFWFSVDDSVEFKWDNFAAWAITTLWCDQPDDPTLLQSVGALALWDRNCVTSRVMSIAAQNRVSLGERFERLFAHTVRYSGARYRAQIERYAPERTFDRDAWTAAHLEDFLAGDTTPLPSVWNELASSEEKLQQSRSDAGRIFDIGHLLAVSAWAEDLSQARDEEERRWWINIHHQILSCGLSRIKYLISSASEPAPYDSSRDFWPYKDEEQLLYRIARLVARMEAQENHREFWEPILKLGCKGSHWVNAFLGRWLIESACHEKPAPAFGVQWLAMLSFAEASLEWKSAGNYHLGGRDIWTLLLGLSTFSHDFWGEQLTSEVEAVWPCLERWACSHVSDNYDTRLFIGFLKTSAARRLRLNGLLLLHDEVSLIKKYFWKEEGVSDSFAGFLQLLQNEHWTELLSNKKALEAFMAFALKLGSLQHPLGSEVLNIAGNRLGK